jgi:fibronectin type 3 domain-containing protein
VLRIVVTGCLIVGLIAVSAGCGGAGSNGEEEESPSEPPSAPTELSATSSDGEVRLSWGTVEDAASYRVYRATSSTDGASGDPLEVGISSADYSDTSAENGTTYYYRVTAVAGEDRESTASGEVEVTPFSEPPNRP